MNRIPRKVWALAASTVLSAVLVACGGGGADTTPRVSVASVRVMGDSLADAGTFGGVRFTIQGNDIYPEKIAQSYGLPKGCNFFVFTGTTFAANPAAGCKNYAIGGAVINPASGGYTADNPLGIGVQFATATAAGNFTANELLVVDGGGNDAAALVTAYLNAAQDGGAAYAGLLGTLLTPTQVGTAAAGGQAGLAAAGGTYMVALADYFHTMIKTGALDKGAQRIVVLNLPGITNTPRFQGVLNAIAAAYGGGSAGAAARAQSEALFKGWVEAFNARLAEKVAGDTRIALVDFYTAFNDQVANPTQFGLSNVTGTACPASMELAQWATLCTDAALAANPPAGQSGPDWYKTWAFSDGFHPTAYGHQLIAQLISRSLANAGWL
jgi:phospholipase/lecithinase/hemolysin